MNSISQNGELAGWQEWHEPGVGSPPGLPCLGTDLCPPTTAPPNHSSPESLRTRNDVFYLQPERSCIAESPLWYSVIPMDRSMLESMLNRILAVREIYEELGRPGEEDLD